MISGTTRSFLAIGSNIEPYRHIPHCLDLLRAIPGASIRLESSWYRTSPWGLEEQADFINLVVELPTRLSPRELLRETQAIEAHLARTRDVKNGPRTIDLDILLFGDRILDEVDLRIPHPGLLLRDFMLMPLIEIAPETMHPERGLPVSTLTGEIHFRQIIDKSRSF